MIDGYMIRELPGGAWMGPFLDGDKAVIEAKIRAGNAHTEYAVYKLVQTHHVKAPRYVEPEVEPEVVNVE